MSARNWIELGILAVLIITVIVLLLVARKKADDLDGMCGVTHGDEDGNIEIK